MKIKHIVAGENYETQLKYQESLHFSGPIALLNTNIKINYFKLHTCKLDLFQSKK